jgi:hypothetical protein
MSTAAVHQRDTGHGTDKQTAVSPAADKEPVLPVQPQQPQGQMSGSGGGGGGGSAGRPGSPDGASPDTEQERPCSADATVE